MTIEMGSNGGCSPCPTCGGVCGMCADHKVPAYVTLTMSGWTDFEVEEQEVCGAFGNTSTDLHLISPFTDLNTSIQLDLVPDLSSDENCCAVYYGEVTYSDFVWDNDALNCTPPPDYPLEIDPSGYVGGNSTIGFYLRVEESGNPGNVLLTLYTTTVEIGSVSAGPDCGPVEATLSVLIPAQTEVDREWFCSCTGDSGNVANSPHDLTSINLYAYDTGHYINEADIGGYDSEGDGPTSVVFTASCDKVSLAA